MADTAQAQAAQQTWDAMPWWQKALVSYGKGASDVVRNDLVQPAKWAAGVLSGQPYTDAETGQSGSIPQLVAPGASAAYAAQTADLNAPFDTLKGFAPKLGADIGSTATLLPAAIATEGLVDAALPGAGAAGGLLGAMRRVAPLSAGGAALGGLEPENRGVNALFGALAPPIIGGVARAAVPIGFPLLNALRAAGILPGRTISKLFELPYQMRGFSNIAKEAVPVAVRKAVQRPTQVVKEVASDDLQDPAKDYVRAMYEQGGNGNSD